MMFWLVYFLWLYKKLNLNCSKLLPALDKIDKVDFAENIFVNPGG